MLWGVYAELPTEIRGSAARQGRVFLCMQVALQ